MAEGQVQDDDLDQTTKATIRFLSAVSKGDSAKVEKYLKEGIDANASDYDSRTALHIAACVGRTDIIEVLLKYKANVNALDRWENTPLDDAVESKQVQCETYLREHGAKTTKVTPTPHHARKANKSGTILKQLSHSELELMHMAAVGNLKEVKTLLEKGECDLNASDYDRRTPLHVAAAEGMLPIVRILIKEGANVNSRDRWGNTPLADALRSNWTDVAKVLQAHGADLPSESTSVSSSPISRVDTTASAPEELVLDEAHKVFAQLHARGVAEKWALSMEEIHLESEPFARGTTGELYLGKWRKMKCVAKRCFNFDVSSAHFLSNFSEQLSAMSHMRHPNVVMFLGACFAVERPLLLMEYCVEGTLQDRVVAAKEGRFRYTNALKRQQMLEIALGMNCLHNVKPPLLHTDLEPSNVLLSDHLHAKVTDFGLRRFFGVANGQDASSKPQLKSNTYRYMAPEVFLHEEFTVKSDMYSYGMVLYFTYSGLEPFHTIPTAKAAAQAAADGQRPSLSDVPSAIRPLLAQCWDPNPKKRPTFDNVIEMIEGKVGSDLLKGRAGSCAIS